LPAKKYIKLISFNLGIALPNIILFSPGLLHIRLLGPNALHSAIGGTAIFLSCAAFIYGNYKIITQREKAIQIDEARSTEEYINYLRQTDGKGIYDNDISIIIEQIEELQRKKDRIRNILLNKFNAIEVSYEKFNGIIVDVEFVFFTNVKSILNKISAFDDSDFKRIKSYKAGNKFSAEFINTKLSIYNEYISFVKNAIEDNEQIILKLDKLLLEISRFDSLEDGEIENMNEIKEIDELIKKSKYFR